MFMYCDHEKLRIIPYKVRLRTLSREFYEDICASALIVVCPTVLVSSYRNNT